MVSEIRTGIPTLPALRAHPQPKADPKQNPRAVMPNTIRIAHTGGENAGAAARLAAQFQGRSAVLSVTAQQQRADTEFDGAFVGAGPIPQSPGTKITEVQPLVGDAKGGKLSSLDRKFVSTNAPLGQPVHEAINVGSTVERLHKAMYRASDLPIPDGTNEPAIFDVLTSLSKAQLDEVRAVYDAKYPRSLMDDLKRELGKKYEASALELLDGVSIPKLAPANAMRATNGILTQWRLQKKEVQKLANHIARFNASVPAEGRLPQKLIGIHNATAHTKPERFLPKTIVGLTIDAVETFLNQSAIGKNAVVKATVDDMLNELTGAKRSYTYAVHSQGGAIASQVLKTVEKELTKRLGSRVKALALMSNIEVHNFAGAGLRFPYLGNLGPKMVFYVNRKDPVPTILGAGSKLADLPPTAVIRTFKEKRHSSRGIADLTRVDDQVHGPTQIYYKHVVSYTQAVANATAGLGGWSLEG